MKNAILDLELNKILNEISEHFLLEDNIFFLRNNYVKDVSDLLNRHDRLKQMNDIIDDGITFEITSLISLKKIISDLKKNIILSKEDILTICKMLEISSSIKMNMQDKEKYTFFYEQSYLINPLSSYIKEINNIILPDYSISDNASIKLKEIREKIRSLDVEIKSIMNNLKNKYYDYLSQKVIVYKDGIELLPVKKEFKGYIKGRVYSLSSTGETLFIIPSEVSDLKNQYSLLKSEESEEIFKIISLLSNKLSKQIDIIEKDYHVCLDFDYYLTITSYGKSKDYTIASYDENKFVLKGLYHPLLDSKKAVKNDIDLTNDRCLLISGANAGGKSLIIKAICLSVLLDKLGLMIPCFLAIIPFIDEVFYLGGDEQSVINNLSTFQSHIISINEIIKNATSSSLVVIDEVCQGTSPKDGEALGIAILKYFKNLKSYTIFTSHYEGLKYFAKEEENISCCSMEFSLEKLKPTYHLLLDSLSPSYGIELARNCNLKEDIINDALEYKNSLKEKDLNSLIEKLSIEEKKLNEEKEKLLKQQEELNILIKKRENAIRSLQEEKENIKDKADKKIEDIVNKKLKEINSAYTNNQLKLSYDSVSKIKGDLNKIKKKEESSFNNKKVKLDLHVGDYVKDEDKTLLEVIEVKKDKVVVLYNGLKINRPIEGLTLSSKPIEIKKPTMSKIDYSIKISASTSFKLNVIGLYVDEALIEVKSFLDKARIGSIKTLYIIHGQGSFKLKNAIWKYLSTLDFVKSYRLGNEYEGGFGVTIVNI